MVSPLEGFHCNEKISKLEVGNEIGNGYYSGRQLHSNRIFLIQGFLIGTLSNYFSRYLINEKCPI